MRSCGHEFFDHPITPFEDVIRRASTSVFESFTVVVRGLLQMQMHSATGMDACPVLIDLLHWYLERSTYPRCFVSRKVDEYGYFKQGNYYYGIESQWPCLTPGCRGSVSSVQRGITNGLCHLCWRPR